MVCIPAVRVQHDTVGATDPAQDSDVVFVSEPYLETRRK